MVPRFVYFDLGNVLVHFDHQIAVEQLSRLSSRSQQVVRRVVFDSELQNRYETGLVSSSQFAADVNAALQCRLPESEILEAISAIFQPNLSILAAIDLVRSADVPLGILSNTCEAHWQWILAKQWPMFGDWWGPKILSYEVQGMKPAAKIYEVCEQHAGCRGASIFFTDDRDDNIQAAASRGWTTERFTTTTALLARLDKWLASEPSDGD